MGQTSELNTPETMFQSNRSGFILLFCLGALLIYQLRYPGQSYPADGLNQTFGLITLILLSLLLKIKNKITERISLFSPCVPAALFLIYAVARWIAAGSPYWGVLTLNGWMLAALWGIAFSNVISLITDSNTQTNINKVFRLSGYWLVGICTVSILHGIYQYFHSYDVSKALLLKEIGTRPPTDLEMGLLHHFTIKRVSSFWGDPNIFALVSVLGFTWAWVVAISAFKERKLNWNLGPAAFLLLTVPFTISITGSRGGALDLLTAAGLVIFYFIITSRWNRKVRTAAIVPVVLLLFQVSLVSQTQDSPSKTSLLDRLNRSDTIRERINYFLVAGKMIKMNPLFGLGPGTTEGYFGQLKTSETRESKFIHNWVLQITAELGIVGLALLIVSIILVFVRSCCWILETGAVLGVWIFTSWIVILFDGLFQLSFYQREVLVLLALFTVLLLSPSVPSLVKKPTIDSRFFAFSILGFLIFPFVWLYTIPGFKGKLYEEVATEAWKSGDTSEAFKFYGKAIAMEPSNPTPYIARSRLYLGTANTTAAALDAKSAVKVQPLSARAHANLAEVFLASKQHEDAIQSITQAIKLYPFKDEYRYIKSRIHAAGGEIEAAKDEAHFAAKYSKGLPGHEAYKNYLNSLTK